MTETPTPGGVQRTGEEPEAQPMSAKPMTDGEILEAMGTDAAKWTDEFLRINPNLNIPDAWGVMVGWFANAIESGRSAGWKAHEQKIREEPRPSYPPSAADLD